MEGTSFLAISVTRLLLVPDADSSIVLLSLSVVLVEAFVVTGSMVYGTLVAAVGIVVFGSFLVAVSFVVKQSFVAVVNVVRF